VALGVGLAEAASATDSDLDLRGSEPAPMLRVASP
jgi:hypothetical protein